METNSPFRFAKQIAKGESLTADEMKEFNPFLMIKLYYYAGYERYANFLNILWVLPKEMQYRLFCVLFKGVTPKGWIKSTKQKEDDTFEVEYLKNKYEISTKVAKQYVELLTDKEREEIRGKYK